MIKIRFILLACICASCLLFSCSNTVQKDNEKLIVFHAGSLSIPLEQIVSSFKKENPNIEILLEPAGSRECARKITDLKKPCDIMISADYMVIDNLLIPDYTSWNIKFASNEMALVFHEGSKYSDTINSDNWYEILQNEDVAIGRSDPDLDPCGYRAVLTTKLAEKHYNILSLSSKILEKGNSFIRPKETDLLALLESNTIDYIFLYRSVAEQHGLNYVILPDSINLKNIELEDYYKSVSVDITGKQPGEIITKFGEPMVYGVTILDSAPNKEQANKFLEFFLDNEKGLKIIEENGQPSIVPTFTNTFNSIPDNLKKFAKE